MANPINIPLSELPTNECRHCNGPVPAYCTLCLAQNRSTLNLKNVVVRSLAVIGAMVVGAHAIKAVVLVWVDLL